MENNNDLKKFLIIALAAVSMFGMVVTGMVLTNGKNRDFELKMATEGYELNSVPGMNGVYWVKIKGDK